MNTTNVFTACGPKKEPKPGVPDWILRKMQNAPREKHSGTVADNRNADTEKRSGMDGSELNTLTGQNHSGTRIQKQGDEASETQKRPRGRNTTEKEIRSGMDFVSPRPEKWPVRSGTIVPECLLARAGHPMCPVCSGTTPPEKHGKYVLEGCRLAQNMKCGGCFPE